MRSIGSLLVLGCYTALFVGCGSEETELTATGSSSGTVAIIDLDAVAKRLGTDVAMNNNVKQTQGNVNIQLTKIRQDLLKNLAEKKEEFGEEPTEEQQKELDALNAKSGAVLVQIQRQARTQFAQYRQGLINKFREQVKPTARKVAAKRGFSIVIPKNDALLITSDPSVDITDQVVEEMLAKASVRRTVPAKTAPAKKPTAAKALGN